MTDQACMVETPSGIAPGSEGWFVVNVRDAAWSTSDTFGSACDFEGRARFPHLGVNIRVLRPGQSAGLYHSESEQECLLVLSGECLLLVEGEEHVLRAWDFVHSPPGTEHAVMGLGEDPCIILMCGSRRGETAFDYPVRSVALRHGVGVITPTRSGAEAYARAGSAPLRAERPRGWERLPWS
ncbi:MAG: cupin domain-containing protein [Thermoleophilia bacterium]